MSDWDKVERNESVPRNDPKISRDVGYGSEVSHNLKLAKNISRSLEVIESQDFRKTPSQANTRKQRNSSRDTFIKEQFQTKPKRKLSKHTPDEVESRRKIRQFIQEQKQQGRLDRHSYHSTAKHPAEKVMTWVFFFLIFGFVSSIPGFITGKKSILIIIGLWFIARQCARKVLNNRN